MEARPKEVKESAQGRVDWAYQQEALHGLKPLMRKLKKHE